MHRFLSGASLALFCLAATEARALPPLTAAKVAELSPGAWKDQFGHCVAASGTWAVVGAPGDDEGGPNVGAAYIYEKTNGSWALRQKLMPPAVSEGQSEARFGTAVAIDANVIAVATQPSLGGNTILIFRHQGDTWAFAEEVFAPFNATSAFASSLAMAGTHLLAGDPKAGTATGNEADEGRVFVYETDLEGSYKQGATLQGFKVVKGAFFGQSLALSGDTLAVGVPGGDPPGNVNGAVDVFTVQEKVWTPSTRIELPGAPTAASACGAAVAMDGDRMLVGCPTRPAEGSTATGHVYFLQRDATGLWTTAGGVAPADGKSLGLAVALSGDRAVAARFGQQGPVFSFFANDGSWAQTFERAPSDTDNASPISMIFAGDTALIGAVGEKTLGVQAGAMFPFTQGPTGWVEQPTLLPQGGQPDDGFGQACDVEGDAVVVGVPGDGERRPGAGAVELFLQQVDWRRHQRFVPNDLSDGDAFGTSVLMRGEWLFVGAPSVNDSGSPGRVYVFRREVNNWTEQLSIAAPEGAHRFGSSLAFDGTTLVVGAPETPNSKGDPAGLAYAFRFDIGMAMWLPTPGVLQPEGAVGGAFGAQVGVGGGLVVVGSPGADGGAGRVRVFKENATFWAPIEALPEPTPGAGRRFGGGLAFDGTALLISAQSNGASDAAAYAFGQQAPGGPWAKVTPLATMVSVVPPRLALDQDLALVGDLSASAVRLWKREAGAWVEQVAFADAPGAGFAGSVALRGGAAVVGAPVAHRASVWRIGVAPGELCATDDECAHGFCVDGVCCQTACGGGDPNDCQACSVAAGGTVDGTCGPSIKGATCRASAGDCDAAEACDGASVDCPTDTLEAQGVTCRAAAGDCDAAELCDGKSADCPADTRKAQGAECRAAAGDCDAAEACDGASTACPADVAAADGTPCKGGTCAGGVCEAGGQGGSPSKPSLPDLWGLDSLAGAAGAGAAGAGAAGAAAAGGGPQGGAGGAPASLESVMREDEGGCGCRATGVAGRGSWADLACVALGLGLARRLRRR